MSNLFGFGSGGSGKYLTIYMLPGGVLRVYDLLSATDVIVGTTVPTAGVSHHVALTRSGGTTRLFLNGVQEGSNWTDTKNYVNSSTEPEIGSYLGQPLTGWVDEARIIVGTAAWTANFTPPTSAYVGTTARTLAAATGAVTLAGPVTRLACGRGLPTTAGAFTLTGQATTLRYAHVVPAVKATLTLNGVVTGLRISRNMVATVGTVTLSGNPVILRYTRLMPAAKGTLVVNGSATNLIWSGAGAKTMPAAVGAFVLSGKDVTFKKVAVIKATVTTYTLSGSETGVATGRRMTAVPGAFVLSGKAAGLGYRRGMSAESGAIILTGKPANLLRLVLNSYFMPAEAGSIQLSGGWNTQLSRSGTAQPGQMNIGRKAHLWRW